MMRHSYIFAILAIVTGTTIASAEPITYSGNLSIQWVNPQGGTSSGAGTDFLSLGTSNHASLHWWGDSTFSATSGQTFSIGNAYVWNGAPTNIPNEVTFRVNLDFQQPNLGPASFDFATQLSLHGDGSLTATFDQGGKSIFTAADGKSYQLELVGLSGSADGTITSEYCEDNGACVLVKLSEVDPPQVPEPTALALGLIGLGTVAVRRWRKRGV
ncbi:MAG: PEP-CTERM sorting domain-containing protein [Planctomycetes bacterium]|nr:PEP-CTERM sorting domain-containing protein [Planctomycetota bacterium]